MGGPSYGIRGLENERAFNEAGHRARQYAGRDNSRDGALGRIGTARKDVRSLLAFSPGIARAWQFNALREIHSDDERARWSEENPEDDSGLQILRASARSSQALT